MNDGLLLKGLASSGTPPPPPPRFAPAAGDAMKTSLYFAAASGSAAGAAAALGLRRSTSLGLREALRMSSRLTDLVRKRAIGRAAARVQGPEAFNALASRAQRSGIDMLLQLPKVESRVYPA